MTRAATATRILALALVILSVAVAARASPRRVVTMDVCADQLAMLLAAPGQLVAVSAAARDPRRSAMVQPARDLAIHGGKAAEILALRPDLVLASRAGGRPMLERLRQAGLRVELLAATRSLSDIRDALHQMGALLGRQAQAQSQILAFDDRLAFLARPRGATPLAAILQSNGFSPGDTSLPGQVLRAAGFRNLTADLGLPRGGQLPLDALLKARPDLLILGPHHAAPATSAVPRIIIPDSAWLCGTPKVLDALEILVRARQQIVAD